MMWDVSLLGMLDVDGWVWQQNYKYKSMDLGMLSLLKWSALAGLSLLTYFKAKHVKNAREQALRPDPSQPIILPLPPSNLPQPTAQSARQNDPTNGLMTYSQFVSIYQDSKEDSAFDDQFEDSEDGYLDEAYKSQQFSTIGGDTRRETLSMPSDDLPSDRQENFEPPSTPVSLLKKNLRRHWQQRTKYLRRQPNSVGKHRSRIHKERFAKRDSRRGEEG